MEQEDAGKRGSLFTKYKNNRSGGKEITEY